MDALSIHIFVVEDDPLVQDLLEDSLTEGGFAVVKATSGEDAIRMLDARGAVFNALVTDINLTGKLLGWQVAKHARESHPEIPVVYMTGGDHDWAANGVPNSVLVSKPFAAAQIVTAVSQLLNKGNTPGA
jgi:DNA-binding NtrC family response regulator